MQPKLSYYATINCDFPSPLKLESTNAIINAIRASTSVDANLSSILHKKSYIFYFTHSFLQNTTSVYLLYTIFYINIIFIFFFLILFYLPININLFFLFFLFLSFSLSLSFPLSFLPLLSSSFYHSQNPEAPL